MGLNSLPHHEYNGKLAELEKRFPEVMEISTIPARVFVKETYVDVFFGSALVKHWGMRIVDAGEGTRPFTVQENAKAIEALPRVWVYRLPY